MTALSHKCLKSRLEGPDTRASGESIALFSAPLVPDVNTSRLGRIKDPLVWVLILGVAALVWFSVHLAGMRIYQVDESTEVYVAKVLAEGGEAKRSLGNIGLFQIPLSWLMRGATRSVDLLASARFVMLEVFWLNVVLMVVATGAKLFSRQGVIALAGAATLAPLWDYGFEVRHDNVLLTGLLLTWCGVRVRPSGMQSYMVAGALAVVLQFAAFKAFVYTLPIAMVILVFPPPGHHAPRWKLAIAWGLGAVVAFLGVLALYRSAGLWGAFVNGFRWTSGTSTTGSIRFGPEMTLSRLLSQTPLLLALVASGLMALAVHFRRRGWAALRWEGSLPEAVLLTIAFGALVINPTPFPYNLVHLVPFAFLFAFRHATALSQEIQRSPALVSAVAAVVAFAHLVPFGVATRRHLDWPNTRQEVLMHRAEALTDPLKDPVFDGIGMVPTRPVVDARAFIHSLHLKSLLEGPGPRIRDMLAARPAAVIIPNYRTDALAKEDHAFFRDHYVSLADDFLVLGNILPAGGGEFNIIHPGRYRITALEHSNLSGTYPETIDGLLTPKGEEKLSGTLDGKPLVTGPVELPVGTHRIESEANVQAAVVWTGPQLDRVARLPSGDHRLLYYNWY